MNDSLRKPQAASPDGGEARAIDLSATGLLRGRVEGRLFRFLDEYLDAIEGAIALIGQVGYRVGPRQVRAADVSLHMEPPQTDGGYITQAPDLVVEVISPNDTWTAVEGKARAWLEFGVREVWIADAEGEAISIRLPDGTGLTIPNGEVLTTPLLEGFELELPRVFGNAKPRRRPTTEIAAPPDV